MGTLKLKLKSDSILRRPWLLAAMIISFAGMACMMILFNYYDADPYISWSCELLDCIFRKTDMGFYEYTTLSLRSNEPTLICCDKTIPMMLPIALWNLPVWIVHEITGDMIVTHIRDITWMKLGFALCIFIIAVESEKIVKKIRPDADSRLVYPLIFASGDIVISTMYAAQDEIVYLMMIVIALRSAISGNIRKFLVFSAIAVALNPQMLIPVLIILLLSEKRILRIIMYLLISYIPAGMFNIIYRNDETYHRYTLMKPGMINELFTDDVGLFQGNGNVSLFLVVLCILAFCACTRKQEDTEGYDYVWVVTVLMTSMTLLSSGGLLNFFYRSLLYVPFMVMLVVVSRQNPVTNLLLYVLYSWSRCWLCILTNIPQNMSSLYISFKTSNLQRIYDRYGSMVLGKFYSSKIPLIGNYGLVTAVCLSLAVIILYINHRSVQDRDFSTFRLRKEIIVFVSSFLVPVILAAFAWMLKEGKAADYSRKIAYGADYIEFNNEQLNDAAYFRMYEGINYFHTMIVYEDDVFLINGEDEDGVRYLNEGGISYGPYIVIYPGSYRINYYGENLSHAEIDCVYNVNGEAVAIPYEMIEASDTLVSFRIAPQEVIRDVEFRIFNSSDETVVLNSIDIEENK